MNDKSYRFRLPSALFDGAMTKAESQDLVLAQVLRRLLAAWASGDVELDMIVRVTTRTAVLVDDQIEEIRT